MKSHLKATILTLLILIGVLFVYFTKIKQDNERVETAVSSIIQLPQDDFLTLESKKIRISDFKGKIIIFNFWASWCGPCIEEVPSLIKLVQANPNIVVIGISGDNQRSDIDAFLKSFPDFSKPPIYLISQDNQKWISYFSVGKLPESFIFDGQGMMVKKIAGTINWHTEESLAYFKSLQSGH